jgi:hypothetical protein
MTHSVLGSPAAVLSSDAAFAEFCTKLTSFKQLATGKIWSIYINRTDKDFCRLVLRVQQWIRTQPWSPNHLRQLQMFDFDTESYHFLCGGDQGMNMFTLKELQELLLPLVRSIGASKTHIMAIEA